MISPFMVHPWGLYNQFAVVVFCRWALHDLSIHGTPMGTPVIWETFTYCLSCDHKSMWVQDKVQVMPGGQESCCGGPDYRKRYRATPAKPLSGARLMMACGFGFTCTLTSIVQCQKHVPGPRHDCETLVQVVQCQLYLSTLILPYKDFACLQVRQIHRQRPAGGICFACWLSCFGKDSLGGAL